MREAAADHVDQQPLVRFRAPFRNRLLQVEVQAHRHHVHPAARLLREHLQLDRLFRLEPDHEAVAVIARAGRDDRERHVRELDHDFRLAALQPLAGAQEERHVRPAPVVDVRAQRDEGFRAAVRRHVVLLEIALDRLAVDRAGRVLAAHRVARDVRQRHRPQRAQHLQLLVAYRIRVERHGRLHRDDAQQLQQVVLHHVAQRAGMVVEARAAADADRLRHRDLHAADVRRLPQRPEDRVAEAQHHQVLHGFLAEIVVDPIDLRFLEVLADRVVDRLRGREIVAQRLFEDDARVRVDEVRGRQVVADRREQLRRRRQVEHADRLAPRRFGEPPVVVRRVHVDQHVLEQVEEAAPRVGVERLLVDERARLLVHELAITVDAPVAAADGDDARLGRKIAVQVRHVQRGQQLAGGQVAAAAEDDHVDGPVGRGLGRLIRHGRFAV